MNLKNLIMSGTVRQLISGIALIIALISAASQLAVDEFAYYNYQMLVVYTISTFLGIIGYPIIYRYLSVNETKNVYLPCLIILINILISIILGFLLLTVGWLKSWLEVFVLVGFIIANCLTSISLGLEKYILFNLGEVIPSLILFFLILYFNVVDSEQLFLYTLIGFLVKIILYIFEYINDSKLYFNKNKIISFNFISDGLAFGATGTFQTLLYRASFLIGMPLVSNFSVLLIAVYPFVEKILVVPQAANAILYRKLVRREVSIIYLNKIIFFVLVVCFISAISLYCILLVLEQYYFDNNYNGISKMGIIISIVFILQAARMLFHNYFQSINKYKVVMIDCIFLGGLCLSYILFSVDNIINYLIINILFYMLSCFYLFKKFKGNLYE